MPVTPNSPTDLLTDPLVALGDSITLHILSYFTLLDILTCTRVSRSWHEFIETEHSISIYRRIAWDIGFPPREMKALIQLEDANSAREREIETSGQPDPNRQSLVDWKVTVKSEHVVRQNWKNGRSRVMWMPLGGNEAWRIKPDCEQGIMYSTSTSDGVLASDMKTHQPLFEYACPAATYAHLEFARGHVIFSLKPSHGFEAHLTPPALQRLTPSQRRALPDPSKSLTYRTGLMLPSRTAYTQPSPRSEDIPPRGHLTYNKTIRPPTSCSASRARVDKEGQEGERAVFATAGKEAVYIWGLDDDECERYSIPREEQVQPMYVEFEDDYIFVCGEDQMHIISRATKKRHLTFPATEPLPAFPEPGAIYFLSSSDPVKNVSAKRFESARVFQHVMRGKMKGDDQWAMMKKMVKTWGRDNDWGFSACHYTSNDLFCANRTGFVYVLRDYKKVLAIADKEKRDKAASRRLLILGFNSPVMQLGTYNESVVFNTRYEIYLLHTSTLPVAPFKATPGVPNPIIHVLNLTDVTAPGLMLASCLQMDRDKLYMVYSAEGENEMGGTVDHRGCRQLPAECALTGGGICIKSWEFDVMTPEQW
ncbi:hypothetical protein IAT38_000931 [Cryptococcus sp. DSM 104549]